MYTIRGSAQRHSNCKTISSIKKRSPSLKAYTPRSIRRIANAVYYPAKNAVFQKEAFAKELASIQTRVDFARSLAICSIFFFIVGLVLFGIQSVWLYAPSLRAVVPFWPSPPCPSAWLIGSLSFLGGVERLNREVWRILAWRAFWLQIGAFGLIFCFSQKAYYADEREFNIRAYGYFATLDDNDLPKIQWNLPDFARQSDISGMVRWKQSKLLVVHDAKADTEPLRPRVDIIDTSLSGNQYEPVDITWPAGEDVPSDLESVCWIKGRTNELLVAESGYYEGRYGRIFRLKIEEASREKPARAQVVEKWHWPKQTAEIEGLSCVSVGQRHLLIAGRREGTLFWGVIRFDQAQRLIELQGTASLPNELLSQLSGTSRKITDLHVEDDHTIWASAAYEPPESGPSQGRGPFRSIIYNLGTLTDDESNPIRFNTIPQDVLVLEGVKVEGLTSGVVPGSRFTIGTDDETLGSVWRALAHPKSGDGANFGSSWCGVSLIAGHLLRSNCGTQFDHRGLSPRDHCGRVVLPSSLLSSHSSGRCNAA